MDLVLHASTNSSWATPSIEMRRGGGRCGAHSVDAVNEDSLHRMDCLRCTLKASLPRGTGGRNYKPPASVQQPPGLSLGLSSAAYGTPRRLQSSLNSHLSASRDVRERAKAELESERPARVRGFKSLRFRQVTVMITDLRRCRTAG